MNHPSYTRELSGGHDADLWVDVVKFRAVARNWLAAFITIATAEDLESCKT